MADKRESEDVTIQKPAAAQHHPSRSLAARKKGFGIGGGYERPYKQKKAERSDNAASLYGPIAEGGFFTSGNAHQRFAIGQAGFKDEQTLYRAQFGEQTSGYEEKK